LSFVTFKFELMFSFASEESGFGNEIESCFKHEVGSE
jgi:hypothetical protein